MSDKTAAKRLRAEAVATCADLKHAAEQLLAWAAAHDPFPDSLIPADALRELGHRLAHRGGRLDMAVSMAHARRKR